MSEQIYGAVGSPLRQKYIEDQILELRQSIEALEQVNENAGSEPLKYYALLDQSGTDAPEATILKNTFDSAPAWARTSAGIYTLSLASAFPELRTAITITGQQGGIYTATVTDEDTITLSTGELLSGDFTNEDELMNKALFKVEVYPAPSS